MVALSGICGMQKFLNWALRLLPWLRRFKVVDPRVITAAEAIASLYLERHPEVSRSAVQVLSPEVIVELIDTPPEQVPSKIDQLISQRKEAASTTPEDRLTAEKAKMENFLRTGKYE
ncbi:MAG: hypothetical protein DDT26_00238 [Dehalococcoidia bacterium]|nr:hypothetical protein [Chloroflexota bacterium]